MPHAKSAVNKSALRQEPVTIVIFGATGNFAHKKLLPALFS